MSSGKTPWRQCAGCMGRFPKAELLRAVRSPKGVVSADETGRSPGRGAYVCRSPACVEKARRARRLERAFRRAVPPEVYERLREMADGR